MPRRLSDVLSDHLWHVNMKGNTVRKKPQVMRPALWYEAHDHKREDAIPGTYRIRKNGQPEANLHSPWSERLERLYGLGDSELPRIFHGYIYNESITLVKPRLSGGSLNFSDLNETVFHPFYALEGAFTLGEDELFATEVCVKLWDQDAWTEWSGWRQPAGGRMRYETIERRVPDSLTARVPGGSVTLEDLSWGNQNDPLKIVLESQSMFRLKFDQPISLDDIFENWVVPLEILIISATGRYSGIESMRITNVEWDVDGLRHHSERWLNLQRAYAPRRKTALSNLGRLHVLEDIEFSYLIPRLLQSIPRLRFSLDLYLSLLSENMPGYLVRCSTATQMVESLHRALFPPMSSEGNDDLIARVDMVLRQTDGINSQTRRSVKNHLSRLAEPTMASRLKQLDEGGARIISDIINDPTWPNQVAHVRNVVTHGLEHSRRLTQDLTATRVVNLICQRLFETHLLISIGFTPEKAKQRVEAKDVSGNDRHYIRKNHAAMKELSQISSVP